MDGHYRNLGIDRTMTVAPSESKVGSSQKLSNSSKLYPEEHVKREFIAPELYSEEHDIVKREFISNDAPEMSELQEYASFILDLIKKVC